MRKQQDLTGPRRPLARYRRIASRAAATLLLALLGAAQAHADTFRVGDLVVTNINGLPTPRGADIAHVTLAVTNAGSEGDVLIAVDVPPMIADAAGFDALPSRVYRGANLRRSQPVFIPAEQTRAMGIEDVHLVLYGIKGPFERGLRVPVRLIFARSGHVEILVDVDAPAFETTSLSSPLPGVEVIRARQTAPPVKQVSAKPETGSLFKCQDGSEMVLSLATTGDLVSAAVWLQGRSYLLRHQPPEPGLVQIVWSDGRSSLTWSPGVQLMWMSGDTHLMCGRGGHMH